MTIRLLLSVVFFARLALGSFIGRPITPVIPYIEADNIQMFYKMLEMRKQLCPRPHYNIHLNASFAYEVQAYSTNCLASWTTAYFDGFHLGSRERLDYGGWGRRIKDSFYFIKYALCSRPASYGYCTLRVCRSRESFPYMLFCGFKPKQYLTPGTLFTYEQKQTALHFLNVLRGLCSPFRHVLHEDFGRDFKLYQIACDSELGIKPNNTLRLTYTNAHDVEYLKQRMHQEWFERPSTDILCSRRGRYGWCNSRRCGKDLVLNCGIYKNRKKFTP